MWRLLEGLAIVVVFLWGPQSARCRRCSQSCLWDQSAPATTLSWPPSWPRASRWSRSGRSGLLVLSAAVLLGAVGAGLPLLVLRPLAYGTPLRFGGQERSVLEAIRSVTDRPSRGRPSRPDRANPEAADLYLGSLGVRTGLDHPPNGRLESPRLADSAQFSEDAPSCARFVGQPSQGRCIGQRRDQILFAQQP